MVNQLSASVEATVAPRSNPSLIDIDGASKTYVTATRGRVHALERIKLKIAEGEFVCVVGPSGCGKSTLLRLLAGLDEYDGGRLTLEGREVKGPSGKVGVVFQAANLLPWLSVRENVRLPLRVGGHREANDAQVDDLLAMVGLTDFAARYPYELSGGMQQRAGICRALARNPQILLMDEPFGALDALTRERMNIELQRIWQTHRKTIMLITHSISEAIFLGDRVVVMSARPGRVLADLQVPIPRPRSFDTIVSHQSYIQLASQVRGLLNAQEGAPNE